MERSGAMPRLISDDSLADENLLLVKEFSSPLPTDYSTCETILLSPFLSRETGVKMLAALVICD
jgi:hypothetical protein